MKKIYILLCVMGVLFSCGEDELSPSGADKLPDRENPDMSKPLIADYKNKYDVSIIYRFVNYRFRFGDENDVKVWEHLKIKLLEDESVDYGLQMLDSVILHYFKDEICFNGETFYPDFKQKFFPKALYLVDSLGGNYSNLYQYMEELNDKESEKYFSYVWNGFEPMFAFNYGILSKASSKDMLKYRNSALYSFISTLLIDRGALKEFPAEFFEPVKNLYGTSINSLAWEEDAPVYSKFRRYYYTPEWYMSKGFALTNNFPKGRGSGKTTAYTTALDTTRNLTFPNRERDLRSMLHVLICENDPSNIDTYFRQEAIQERMRILIRELYKRGIDVFAINAATKEFFND